MKSIIKMDEKSRYVNHIFLRENKSKFYIAKLLNMFLSGGVIASFPFALSMLVNMCLSPSIKDSWKM